LRADWGFSCLVEAAGKRLLFDTGASGPILFSNMEKLGVEIGTIDGIFISHAHFDHTGGLLDILAVHSAPVYVPRCIAIPPTLQGIEAIGEPREIHPGLFSTGEIGGVEQALAVGRGEELVVIVGCSHPGVGNILRRASVLGRPVGLIGGLHGFAEFDLIEDLDLICPTHCTFYKKEIIRTFPEKTVSGGVGRIIEIPDR
ncbi:MAG: MBL fold metallo-hydrolase, partial [Deltaproteobacteria bacterium]|nr:MBL fold metallo-hydrolase [Deltaproteobacteria bacterium]